ncbi:NERD domain-containing protein [Sutcliffiella halmapala]|uniref:NERD domain-containing protein n=1 Tax=Sutcliffiella halmapala TaxID=79882 RepID=UPI000995642B|nr:NERD domain-containing protein [Sutcliffiella halmapala]
MGQLIKLQDYISRYEVDVYRYPSQFIRLKKQQWEVFLQQKDLVAEINTSFSLEDEEPIKQNKFTALINSFKKKEEMDEELPVGKINQTDRDLEEWELPKLIGQKSPEEKKQLFLNAILPIQLKWASSTIRHMSYLQKNYKRESTLLYFLQRFPDTFFVMYKPIFLVKQAPVELEIILITPTEILTIYFMEEEKNSVILGNTDRFWTIREKEKERKIVNPTISINRMGSIIKNVLSQHEIDFPVTKILLHPYGYIDSTEGPSDIQVLDKRSYDKWFEKMRANKLPLKHNQLKAAGALLSHCQSTYVDRPEWK